MDEAGVPEFVDPFGVDGDGEADGEGGAEVVVSNGLLPSDVESVWGVSDRSRVAAAHLIEVWGLSAFRDSWVHRMAVQEGARVPRRAIPKTPKK